MRDSKWLPGTAGYQRDLAKTMSKSMKQRCELASCLTFDCQLISSPKLKLEGARWHDSCPSAASSRRSCRHQVAEAGLWSTQLRALLQRQHALQKGHIQRGTHSHHLSSFASCRQGCIDLNPSPSRSASMRRPATAIGSEYVREAARSMNRAATLSRNSSIFVRSASRRAESARPAPTGLRDAEFAGLFNGAFQSA